MAEHFGIAIPFISWKDNIVGIIKENLDHSTVLCEEEENTDTQDVVAFHSGL